MKNQSISVHTIVKNEARWIWYSIMSVIDYVNEVIVYDTGSTDSTLAILETIKHPNLKIVKCGPISIEQHTALRNEMLKRTKTDWFWIVDGDEVYPKEAAIAMQKCLKELDNHYIGVIHRWWRCVGDVYHHRSQGDYQFFGKKDNWSIRVWRREIPGMHWRGEYSRANDSLFDEAGNNLAWQYDKLYVLDAPRYFHLTHLQRSDNPVCDLQIEKRCRGRIDTYSFGMGTSLPPHATLPEVFFMSRPEFILEPKIYLPVFQSLWNYLSRYFFKRGIRALKRRFRRSI